jgi:hypothetical protein
MPFVTGLRTKASELMGILLAKLPTPFADRLIRHDDPTGEQEFFHIAVAEAEPVLEPDAMADDLDRKAVMLIAVGRLCAHTPSMAHGARPRQLLNRLTTPGKRLLVIHDRGEQHKGAPVEAIIRDAGGRLVLKPQPAYSPELNPQEWIWKWLRRVVMHNHWFETLHEQIEAIRNFFCYLAGVKDQVQRLCGFKTPESLVA